MTIIAGFKGIDGVVICADTQETFGPAKRNIPKLRFEPDPLFSTPPVSIAAAFCGATDNGPFVDKLVDVAWSGASKATSLSEACFEIEDAIKETYKDFGKIYQPGYVPDAELIYGVKMNGASRLFHAVGPVVNEEHGKIAGGAGAYMADFLASRINGINIEQLIILAAYVLFQTKEHVDGCGGNSHIAVLPHRSEARMLNWKEVEYLNKMVECADHYLADLIVECSDPNKSDQEINNSALATLGLIHGYRHGYKDELEKWKKLIAQFGGKP